MESGWVREEYSRALSLAQEKVERLQLIPVILRDAELPGFLTNRNWVDFRRESMFNESLERLIWGITGKKPSDSSPKPLKQHAILDRRLATELIALFSQSGTTMNVDSRTPSLLLFALGR